MEGPTDDQAVSFAVMLNAGLPPEDALAYFIDTSDPQVLTATLRVWQRSRAVKRALTVIMGKSWQEMTLDERIRCSLDWHYNNLAYLLFSTNYISVQAADKGKMDSARVALEAKLAGTAGKVDALTQFFEDVKTGRVKLNRPIEVPKLVN